MCHLPFITSSSHQQFKFFSGNSVYGYSIMNKTRFTNVTFCGPDKASKMINDPFFHSLDEFRDETFEVNLISITPASEIKIK